MAMAQAPLVNPNEFSLSAFIKASHRLRTMCLISGYVIQRYGRLKAYIATKQKVEV